MKLRQSVSAAALVSAALLLLTGCVPSGLLPQRPEIAPIPEVTFSPDDWADGDAWGDGDDWIDEAFDDEFGDDAYLDEDDLYSWVSTSDDSPWVVSVDVDMNAFAMVQDENLYLFLLGDAKMNGKSIVLTLSSSAVLMGPGSPEDDYVLTIDNVDAREAMMTIVKNGAAQPSVVLTLLKDW